MKCPECGDEDLTICDCNFVPGEETCDNYWLICPHCNHRHETTEMHGEFVEDFECENCEKVFEAECYVSYTYTGKP